MSKKLFYFGLLFLGMISQAQECPVIFYPSDGTTDVPVDVTLTWPEVTGINGYLLSLGTTPGGNDIINREVLGLRNSFKPPVGLPESTTIYASLSIIQSNTIPLACNVIRFTTSEVTTPPTCTIMAAPDNNAANVTVVTDLIWNYSPTATSYNLSIGTSEGGTEILDNFNVGNVLSYNPPADLPQDVWIYVTVRPENENGIAQPCNEERFFTGAINDPCEDIDPITGETKTLAPDMQFPSLFIKCKDSPPIDVLADDGADGYRWYRIENGSETLLSQSRNFKITEAGNYFLEAYNWIDKSGTILECSSINNFNVLPSESPIIESIDIRKLTAGKQVTVNVTGVGDYEYALDDENGPYQKESSFYNVPEGPHVVFVRDKNGCGIVSRLVERGLKSEDFPTFFTPNHDGFNDFWQFVRPAEVKEVSEVLEGYISIFDRYGNLLFQLDPNSRGWDGNFKGRPLPSSDYWFRAVSTAQQEIKGHFTLKR